MALPFLPSKQPRRRDHIVAVDLGGHTTKAVSICRCSQGFELNAFAVLDAPVAGKTASADLLGEHLKAVMSTLQARCKAVSLAVGLNDAFVRQVELPLMSRDDLRLLLKTGSKNYLQQDYANHVFDCEPLPLTQPATEAPKAPKSAGLPKHQVLVAGARAQFVNDLQMAVTESGLVADHVVPGLIGPINAFEFCHPQEFANETVALVDLGFQGCTVCILAQGEMALSRVLTSGSDRLTHELASLMGISYAEAEGIKVGMPWEVHGQLEALIGPVGRELRASIDFYEHQHDRPVTLVFVSGGAARSDLILQILQTELMVECRAWNPTGFLTLNLPPPQQAELEQVAPQLAVAVGTAMATL